MRIARRGALPLMLSAVIAAQAEGSKAEHAPASPARLALLIGIDDYQQVDGEDVVPSLKGCRNDLGLVRALLVDRFGFTDDEILELPGEKATHAAIVTAFDEHLVQRAGRQTEVVVWYSGHGSLVPDPTGKDPAERGLGQASAMDSTWIAYDSRAIRRDGSYDITDDELFSLLRAVPSEHIVFVTDCCHSGGLVRGDQPPAGGVRYCPGGLRPLDRTLTDAFWPKGGRVPFFDDDADVAELEHVLHVAACSALQEAGEVHYSDRHYGTMTWYLTRALSKCRPDASWQEVCDLVRARVAGKGTRGGQAVQLHGPRRRAVFGGIGREVPSGYPVARDGEHRFLVSAGRVHGIGEGATFDLVDYDGKRRGRIEVDDVRTTTSGAKPVGRVSRERRALRAVPISLGEAAARLRIAVQDGVDARLLAGCELVTFVPEDRADYTIARVAGALQLRCHADEFVRPLGTTREAVQKTLYKEHCWQSLWSGVARPGAYDVRVRVEQVSSDAIQDGGVAAPVRTQAGARGSVGGVVGVDCFDTTDQGDSKGGAPVRIVIENRSAVDLHVQLISVAQSREIGLLESDIDNKLIPAGEERRRTVWVGRDQGWLQRHGDPMVDRYLAVATLRAADFSAFEAEAPPPPTRGEPAGENVPGFLREAIGGPRTRGDGGTGAWGIGYCDLLLVSPERFAALSGR